MDESTSKDNDKHSAYQKLNTDCVEKSSENAQASDVREAKGEERCARPTRHDDAISAVSGAVGVVCGMDMCSTGSWQVVY